MLKQKMQKLFTLIAMGIILSFSGVLAQEAEMNNELTATLNEDNSVNLQWTAPTDEAIVSFNIYRSILSSAKGDPSEFEYEQISSTSDLSFSDNLEEVEVEGGASNAYYYYVASVDKEGNEIVRTNYAHVSIMGVSSTL
jgi:fibronectin type 3 domain-containing protein